MPGPLGLPGGGDSLDMGGLQKLLLALPSFQGQFGNVGVKFNPREALLQQTLLERLTGGGRQQETPPINQTPTVPPPPFPQVGPRPLGLGAPGRPGFGDMGGLLGSLAPSLERFR